MDDVKVYRMDDYVWMAGVDLESCVQAYIADTGMDREDLDDPRELTDEEMGSCKFYDEPPFDGVEGAHRSFREQLARLVADGQQFPTIFALTEY